MADKKLSKKDRQKELRQLDRQLQGGGSGVDYSKVSDRHVDDKRFEREMEHKISLEKSPYGILKEAGDTVRICFSQNKIYFADRTCTTALRASILHAAAPMSSAR
jgi:hypothetical protein